MNKDLTIEEISQLLWAAQGITHKEWGFSFRSAPSAGALYPLEIYVLTKNGLFHYLPQEHQLEVLNKDDLRESLAKVSLGQNPVATAPLDLIICAVYERTTFNPTFAIGFYKLYNPLWNNYINKNILYQKGACQFTYY